MRPTVWAFFRDTEKAATGDLRNFVRSECKKEGFDFQERPTRTVNLFGGRSCGVIAPDVATQLYRQLHRPRVAVLSLDREPWVCLYPHADTAIKLERLARLPKFVRYKALYRRVRTQDQAAGALSGFRHWLTNTPCDGDADPRVLPFHLFESKLSGDLNSEDGRRSFSDAHGAPRSREDGEGLKWGYRVMHGYADLQVAGCQLTRGFHWDVRPAGGAKLIYTPEAAWKVHVYLNIYPDGGLRGQSPYAKKVTTP